MKDTVAASCSKEGNRIAYLDALKCLGILLVIRGHVELMGFGIDDTYKSISSLMMYSFNMPIFFFVSGLLAYKEQDLGSLRSIIKLKSKFLYLVLPSLFFVTYTALYEHTDISHLLAEGFGKYWFTPTLFEVFVLYSIAALFAKSRKVLLIFLGLLSIAGIGYLCKFSKFDIALLDLNHLAKYFQFFAIGVAARMYQTVYKRFMNSPILNLLSLASFFILAVVVFYDGIPSAVHHFLRDIVLRWVGTFVVISFFYKHQALFSASSLWNKCIMAIGQNSLAIYLLQYFFLPDLHAYSTYIKDLDTFSIHILAFGYTVVITLVCLLFIKLLSGSAFLRQYALGKK